MVYQSRVNMKCMKLAWICLVVSECFRNLWFFGRHFEWRSQLTNTRGGGFSTFCYPSGRPRRNVRRRLTRRRGPRGVWPATGDLINDGDVQWNDHDMMEVSINGIPIFRWMAYNLENPKQILGWFGGIPWYPQFRKPPNMEYGVASVTHQLTIWCFDASEYWGVSPQYGHQMMGEMMDKLDGPVTDENPKWFLCEISGPAGKWLKVNTCP